MRLYPSGVAWVHKEIRSEEMYSLLFHCVNLINYFRAVAFFTSAATIVSHSSMLFVALW